MLRAKHYSEAFFVAVLFFQALYGLQRLGVLFRRYRVNVDEIDRRLADSKGLF